MKTPEFVSNLKSFSTDPLQFMRKASGDGRAKRLRIGPKSFVVVFDADAAQEILVKRPDVYVQNRMVFDRIMPVTGKKGLVQLAGDASRSARAKSRPMFAHASLESARSIVETYSDELIGRLGKGGDFAVTEEMTGLILQTALRILLGIESPELVSKLGGKFLRLNHLCGLRMRALMPTPLFIPTPENREIKRLQSEIRALVIEQLLLGKEGAVPKAFAEDDALVDQCMTFLFAGHETTAASLAFTFLILAKHPEYQDRIASGDEDMTKAIYQESLRLFPPAYMLAREAIRDDELGGVRVRKSDAVIISITELHRNPRYFDRPNEFQPERFLSPSKHPFAFIPFGAGGKSCVGERLAHLEAGVVLRKICQAYRLLSVDESIQTEPLITLHPVPNQKIRLERREESLRASS